ncbi:type IV pilus secretin PilQ [Zooshikella harenae]|uniref:Type IV pilus secretin PilQ n=1 Tax=Zooshikella harenae TaxID=2827238 RepID=A0ABS5Z9K5_9GAMM|nr:type IV pilus secretin PilQ [Zooshikella harenae]MBU2709572.1 type IV pilus secretin PilQ [Zooshikella harenae]
MNTIRLRKAGLAIATVLAFNSWQALASVITDLDVASLPGEKVELKLQFDGAVPTPKGYTVERPARISIDLPGAQSGLAKKFNEIGFGNTKSITVLETKDKTRLVVNLNQPAKYATRIDGNNLYILIGTDGQDLAAAQQTSQRATTRYTQTPPAVNNKQTRKKLYNRNVKAISSIDFERGAEGEGNIVIQLSNPNVPLDMNEQGGRIRLEFPETQIPTNLRNRLDVVDFATPVHYIDATVERGNAVITIEPEGEYDYLAYQTDNTLTISVKSLTAKEVEQLKRDRALYTGEKLSLNFQNIDVRSVLQLIADFTDLNLVASDTVTGDITLRLQNVPWDQALDLVLKAKGLDKRQVGNVLMVAPAEEIAAREKQELENNQQIEELAPTYTELVQINYADASEIAGILQGSSGEGGVQLLSERGTVQVVNRTNSLLIKDTRSKLDELRDLLTKIDIPVKQVMIEARIVSAEVDMSSDLGVQWTGGKIKKNGKWRLGGNDDQNTTGSTTPGNAGLVSLPLGSPTSTFNIGFVSNSAILNLELNALESENRSELISQPKILTQDKQMARIETGQEVPYQEASSSGATSTSFKKAVLSLEVTPQITPDGHITLKVNVKKDDVGETEFNGELAIDTNEVDTTVLVPDGETLVLGGVFEEENELIESKVPFLGDLPAIGRLFKRTTDGRKKNELLIFITPRIVDNALTKR